MRRLLLLIALVLCGARAGADPNALIARLNYAGFDNRHHCTAALVGAGHVVTAAHCIPAADVDLVLLFGYDREVYERALPGRTSDFRRDEDRDVAVWCDADPQTGGLPIAATDPQPGDLLRLVGYGRPQRYLRQETECPVLQRKNGMVLLGCQVGTGTSGAPALTGPPEAARFVGTASASGSGLTLTLQVTDADIARLCGSQQSSTAAASSST